MNMIILQIAARPERDYLRRARAVSGKLSDLLAIVIAY